MNRVMKKFLVTLLCAISAAVCMNAQGVANTAVTFMSDPADGSIIVRTSAAGRNRVLARDFAAKNALKAVIFKGVDVPGNLRLSKPLVTTLNAEEKYGEFFEAFFADKGPWRSFVNKTKDRKAHSNRVHNDLAQTHAQVTFRVYRAQLRQYLIENNIIEK